MLPCEERIWGLIIVCFTIYKCISIIYNNKKGEK